MNLKSWCKNQAEEAKKHKWIQGVKLGKDPGNGAIVEWVEKFAKNYREEYKKCFENILKKVEKAVKTKLNDKSFSDEQLHALTDIIIEEFTKEWIKEAAIDTKHIEEI